MTHFMTTIESEPIGTWQACVATLGKWMVFSAIALRRMIFLHESFKANGKRWGSDRKTVFFGPTGLSEKSICRETRLTHRTTTG
jgi:hypothetical protein